MFIGLFVLGAGFFALVVAGLVVLLTLVATKGPGVQDPPRRRPDEVLRRRLDEGDIDADEYHRRMRQWQAGGGTL